MPHAGKAATPCWSRAQRQARFDDSHQRLVRREASRDLVQRRRHRSTGLDRDLPGPRELEKTRVPGMACLLSPDTDRVPAHGMCSMALAKHFAVRGGDSQRSGWHLANPKVGGQYSACLRDIGSRPEGESSSSVLDDPAGGGDCDQHRGAGEYGPLRVSDTAGSNDQDQQEDQAGENHP
jgi:hypothetical protein